MAGNRRPKKPDERFNPEDSQEGGEDEEEEDVADDSDEDNPDTPTGSSGSPVETPPDSPLTHKIRLVRADNQRLETQLAGYEPQIAAARSMQYQFFEAVNTIEACMNKIKQSMTSKQKAYLSEWAENRMSEVTREQTMDTEPRAGTSTESGTGNDAEREGEDFKTIKDRFDKLKRLIAIREEAEAGGSIKFSEASQKEIADMENTGGANDPGGITNVVDVGTGSGGGNTDDNTTVETPAEINECDGGVRTEDTESSEEE